MHTYMHAYIYTIDLDVDVYYMHAYIYTILYVYYIHICTHMYILLIQM